MTNFCNFRRERQSSWLNINRPGKDEERDGRQRDETGKTYKNDDAFHIIFPCLDQRFIMALSLFNIDGPKLCSSLIIFFGIMTAAMAVVEGNGAPRETFITLYSRGGDVHLRRVLFCRALGVAFHRSERDGMWQDVPRVGGLPFCASMSGTGSVVSAIMIMCSSKTAGKR